jgi:hypothetical protein
LYHKSPFNAGAGGELYKNFCFGNIIYQIIKRFTNNKIKNRLVQETLIIGIMKNLRCVGATIFNELQKHFAHRANYKPQKKPRQ